MITHTHTERERERGRKVCSIVYSACMLYPLDSAEAKEAGEGHTEHYEDQDTQ